MDDSPELGGSGMMLKGRIQTFKIIIMGETVGQNE